MAVDSMGAPSFTNWATLAFTSTEDHYGALYEDSYGQSVSTNPETVMDGNTRARAEFMRIIMRGQMLNAKQRASQLRVAWQKAEVFLPKLSESDSLEVQEVLFSEWGVILEMFSLYAPEGSMDLKEYQRMCEDNDIFSARDSVLLASRAFNRIVKIANCKTLDIQSGTFVASLLVMSQIRHNDIYERSSSMSSPAGYLRGILSTNFRSLATKLSFKCLPKEALCSVEFLSKLREVYDDLISVFEKYAARHNRDIYTSLPYEHVAELFLEGKLAETKDVDAAKDLHAMVCSGPINGRDIIEPPHPPDEYLFPEVVEAAVLTQYDFMVNNNGLITATKPTGKAAKRPVPAAVDPEEDAAPASPYPVIPTDREKIDILVAFNVALQKLVATLHIVPEEPTKKGYRSSAVS